LIKKHVKNIIDLKDENIKKHFVEIILKSVKIGLNGLKE
jgi:hypothetical protein